jgi:hypothetical protein
VIQAFWRRALRCPALLSLATSFLSACAGTQSGPPPVPPPQALREEPPRPPPRLRPPVPRPARKPASPAPGAPPAQSGGATPPQRVAKATLAAPPAAGELIGLDKQKAIRLFGKAAETITQPPATVWRYKAPSCQLDLFFYLDLRSGRMRTLHYAFKGDVGDLQKRQDCLRAIVAARAS